MGMVGRKKKRDRWAGLPVAGESGASFWVPMADLAIMEPGFAICSIELVGGAAGSTGKHGGRTWDNAIHHYDMTTTSTLSVYLQLHYSREKNKTKIHMGLFDLNWPI